MTPYFRQIGGARIGKSYWNAFNVTFPFAALRVEEERIVLGVLGTKRYFSHQAITRLSRWRGVLSVGLRMEHTVTNYDPFIVFWTFNYRSLSEVLRQWDYPVFDTNKNTD